VKWETTNPVVLSRFILINQKGQRMKTTISFKHLESTPGLNDVTHEKSEKLKKYFDGKVTLHWNFTVEKDRHVAHCQLTGSRMNYFAEATTESIYSAIDEVIHKLERQVQRKKEIWKNHKHAA
jgi:putative sigma-54 modulation protein